MGTDLRAWVRLEGITWRHVALALAIWAAAQLLSSGVRGILRRVAEGAVPRLRLLILRTMPIVRLVIWTLAIAAVVLVFVEPTVANAVALLASAGLALAFVLKDYGSAVVAGVVLVAENVYQPGDWIELGGVYGEVRSIGLRATRLVTADDTAITIPNSRIWAHAVANATGGERSLLCVSEFYLHPEHDAARARARLAEVAEASAYRKAGTAVAVIVTEKPWGTQYRVKAYASESRDQYLFISDVTVRGKEALGALGIRFAQAPYAPRDPA